MDDLKVFVTSVIDPSMFWVRIGCDVELESEKKLDDIINDYVSQIRDDNASQDITLAPNQIILAKSNEHGGRWLRATTVSSSSNRVISEIDVVFTSYGSNELVGWNDIITSVPDLVCEWAKSAECFSLDGIEPMGDDGWSAEAIEYFSNCVLKKRLSCEHVRGGRLVIYTSKGKSETIQDCLIRKRFAKRSSDEGITVSPSKTNGRSSISKVTGTGGIPEFDAAGLFFRSDSPASPSEEALPPTRDFEMELHRQFVDPSDVGLPNFYIATLTVRPNQRRYQWKTQPHSDDIYCGRRSAAVLGRSEPYANTVRDIKDELAEISKANRQLVRPDSWRAPGSRLWSNRSATDPRNGFKSLKKLERAEDDWRMPNASHSLGSPAGDFSRRVTYEQESFNEDLQNLRVHLNKNSTREVILTFLRQILIEGDKCHHRLFSCLTTIVDATLDNSALVVPSLDLLESLKSEQDFYECLADVIGQCHAACIQVADFEFLKLRLTSFTEFLAHLILRFPEESLIVESALGIADFWIASKIKSTDELSVQKIYASCLKNFVCIVARDSIRLVRQNLSRLLNAVREMLLSDVQLRSVREIWLDLLLFVERMETESRIMSTNAPDQSLTRLNGSMDFNDMETTVDGNPLVGSVDAASPTLSSTSHSSFRSPGAASQNESLVTRSASRSSPPVACAASWNKSGQDFLLRLPDQNRSKSTENRPRARKTLKMRAQNKMSLQSFFETPASPVNCEKFHFEKTSDCASFRDDVNCVMCSSQYHLTGDCPEHSSRFIL